jgi:hypothetical protein
LAKNSLFGKERGLLTDKHKTAMKDDKISTEKELKIETSDLNKAISEWSWNMRIRIEATPDMMVMRFPEHFCGGTVKYKEFDGQFLVSTARMEGVSKEGWNTLQKLYDWLSCEGLPVTVEVLANPAHIEATLPNGACYSVIFGEGGVESAIMEGEECRGISFDEMQVDAIDSLHGWLFHSTDSDLVPRSLQQAMKMVDGIVLEPV